MAYSITLAHSRGLINEEQRDEWFGLVSSVGLSMDHDLFDDNLIAAATEAIKKTRDGKQRFAVPSGQFGKCIFLNDVSIEELQSVLKVHKEFVKERYGSGEGKEAYVDAGDLGANPETYAQNGTKVPTTETKKVADDIKLKTGGKPVNGSIVSNGNGVNVVECSC